MNKEKSLSTFANCQCQHVKLMFDETAILEYRECSYYDCKKTIHNKTGVIKIIILLCIFALQSYAQPTGDWKLQKDRDSIFIYTKPDSVSRFKSVKAITEFRCSLPLIVNLIKNVNSHYQWVSHCMQSTLLKSNGDSSIIFYEYYDVPWPASDRDVILHTMIHFNLNKNAVLIVQEGKPGYLPEKNNLVRVREYHGSWKLIAQSNGTIYGEYTASIDPGGYIPAWIINLFAATVPYESITNLKMIIARKGRL